MVLCGLIRVVTVHVFIQKISSYSPVGSFQISFPLPYLVIRPVA